MLIDGSPQPTGCDREPASGGRTSVRRSAEVSRSRLSLVSILKRLGIVDEVADLTFGLVSDASSYVTGQVIARDGGASTCGAG
jgi:NAD(P)-dependent dehydrogenase (short-subunit alcohol dehydrogenase family)